MSRFIKPKNYRPILGLKQTEKAIKLVKDTFQQNLSAELRLRRVTAPLFVLKDTGINDDLNGVERKVDFTIKDLDNSVAEVVNSLAKWKRLALADYMIEPGFGIYTDMNAIRPDEELSNLHSIYVDQWDWERVLTEEQRTPEFLELIVNKLYEILKRTEFVIFENHPGIRPILPESIKHLHAEELREEYPGLSPAEREAKVAKKYGAVFISGIGGALGDGSIHDGRAPDYDDWSSPGKNGFSGLNGDIILWNPILEMAFEISSMGIRVNRESLLKQLEITHTLERKNLYFHRRLLNGELPASIGGGFGQSRICMFFLRKAHIGEIQCSIWPDDMRQECKKHNIILV